MLVLRVNTKCCTYSFLIWDRWCRPLPGILTLQQRHSHCTNTGRIGLISPPAWLWSRELDNLCSWSIYTYSCVSAPYIKTKTDLCHNLPKEKVLFGRLVSRRFFPRGWKRLYLFLRHLRWAKTLGTRDTNPTKAAAALSALQRWARCNIDVNVTVVMRTVQFLSWAKMHTHAYRLPT